MVSLHRRFVAELLGTFTLVFFGCAAVIAGAYPGTGVGLTGIAIAHALALSVGVTATMGISGGHLNPAITIGLFAVRRIDLRTMGVHIAAQLVGAAIAGFALKAFYPAAIARVVGYGVPQLSLGMSSLQGIGLEAILAFLLMSAVFGTCVAVSAPRIGGFGIGLTLGFLILAAGPLTGAAVNPARSFGPALASGTWTSHALYWIGPVIGAVAAAFVWDRYLLRDESREARR